MEVHLKRRELLARVAVGLGVVPAVLALAARSVRAQDDAVDFDANQIAAGDGFTLVSYTINNAPPSPFLLPSSQLVVFLNGGAAVAAGDNYNPNPLLDQLIPQMQAVLASGLEPQHALVQVWDTPDGNPPPDFVPSWPINAGPNAADHGLREQILTEASLHWTPVTNTLLMNDISKSPVLDELGSDAFALRVAKGNLATRVVWQAVNEVWGWTFSLALAYQISDGKGAGNTGAGLANPAQGSAGSTAGLFDGGMQSTSLIEGGEVSNRYYVVRRYKTPQGVQIEVFLLPDALKQMNSDMLTRDLVKAVTDARALGTVNRVQVVNSMLDMPDESKGPFQPYDSIKTAGQNSSARARTLAELDSKNGIFVLQPSTNPQFYAALGTVLTAVNSQAHLQ